MSENSEHGTGIKFQNVFLLGLIVAGIGIVILLQSKDTLFSPTSTPLLKKGTPAPDFTLPGLDGEMVRLADQKGKVVFLNIWATWCPPCVQEMPSMEKLYNALHGENFEILAVSIDAQGLKAVAPFMKKSGLTFPALIDSKGAIKTVYGITGVPESFIIDQQGILIKKIIGPVDWATGDIFRFFSEVIETPYPR